MYAVLAAPAGNSAIQSVLVGLAISAQVAVMPSPGATLVGSTLSVAVVTYVKRAAALGLLVKPLTVTLTSTNPLPAGLVTMQLVTDAQLTPIAGVDPNLTVVALGVVLKLDPVTTTLVPPAAGPLFGFTELIVG